MPSRPADGRYAWLRQCAEAMLAITVIALGWTHGVLYVEGRSMEPALSAGDLILYRRTGVSPERGDLIVFEHNGALVVHRVAGLLRSGAVRTRGDANDSLDADPVDPTDVRGEVLATLPIGRLIAWLVASMD